MSRTDVPNRRECELAVTYDRPNMLAQYREELLAPFENLARKMGPLADELRSLIARARSGVP